MYQEKRDKDVLPLAHHITGWAVDGLHTWSSGHVCKIEEDELPTMVVLPMGCNVQFRPAEGAGRPGEARCDGKHRCVLQPYAAVLPSCIMRNLRKSCVTG